MLYISYYFPLFLSAKNWNQGPVHARQYLYHWAIFPANVDTLKIKNSSDKLGWWCSPLLLIKEAETHGSLSVPGQLGLPQNPRSICSILCKLVFFLSLILCTLGEGIRSPGTVIRDDCESHVGAGNWTRVLWKNNQCTLPLRHCSSPINLFLRNNNHQLHIRQRSDLQNIQRTHQKNK